MAAAGKLHGPTGIEPNSRRWRSGSPTLPWITLGVIGIHGLATQPREVKTVLKDCLLLGVDIFQAALAWLVISIAGTLLPGLLGVGLFFGFNIDALWLLSVTMTSGGSFFAALAVLGFSYLFGVEKVTIWHDALIVALTAGFLTFAILSG